MRTRSIFLSGFAAIGMAVAPLSLQGTEPLLLGYSQAEASEIKVIVNDEVVTTYDIQRRTAFLRLQRRKGNLRNAAIEELTDEALKRGAVRRAGIRIPDSSVNSAFARFAKDNGLSTKQLGSILGQAGVTSKHFKEFIRLQIGWGQTVQLRSSGGSAMMSEQDVVAKMLEQGGPKPTSTEYILQQVIFVVPDSKRRSQLKKRRTEANNMRSRINGCDGTKALAAQLRDVSVRDLGRVLELQLPDRWSKDVTGLKQGQTTRVKETERGAEFLIVCRARSVSDDRVAQLEFSTKELEASGGDIGKKFLAELRENAKIRRR